MSTDTDSIFHSTQWSLIRCAQGQDPDVRRQALEQLCTDYYQPIRRCLLCCGLTSQDADDLLHEFLISRFLGDFFQRNWDESKRFRSFLRVVLRNFVIDRKRRASRADQISALDSVIQTLSSDETPSDVFDREWAADILSRSLQELWQMRKGTPDEFRFRMLMDRVLQPTLQGTQEPSYRELAQRYRIEDAAKAGSLVLNELRRLGGIVTTFVCDYSNDESDVNDELQYLMRIVKAAGRLSVPLPMSRWEATETIESPDLQELVSSSNQISTQSVEIASAALHEIFEHASMEHLRLLQDPRMMLLHNLLNQSVDEVLSPSLPQIQTGRDVHVVDLISGHSSQPELLNQLRQHCRTQFQKAANSPAKTVWLLLYHATIAAALNQTGQVISRLTQQELQTAFSMHLADRWFGAVVEEIFERAYATLQERQQ